MADVDLHAQIEQLNSRITRDEIEHEQALADLASRNSQLETLLETESARVAEGSNLCAKLRQDLELSQSQIESLKSSTKTDSQATLALKQKAESVEREKRDLLVQLQRLQDEKNSLQAECDDARTKQHAMQANSKELESQAEESKEKERSLALTLQTVENQLDILRNDKSWYETELTNTRNEFAAFRREKHAEHTQMQSSLMQAQNEVSSLTATLTSLRSTHESQQSRLTDAHTRISELSSQIASQEAAFKSEITTQKRLVTLMEEKEKTDRARLDEFEREWTEKKDELLSAEETWQAKLDEERARGDQLESKLEEMRMVNERLASSQHELINPNISSITAESSPAMTLSPSASLAAKAQKSGFSFSEVYSKLIQTESQLIESQAENKRLGEYMSQILVEIEEHAPVLRDQRLEYERISNENSTLASQLATCMDERDSQSAKAESYRLDLTAARDQAQVLEQQCRDLGRQVRVLLREIAAHNDPSIIDRSINDPSVDQEDENAQFQGLTDTDSIISANLVTFSTLDQLQRQNQQLLQATRELGRKLDSNEEHVRAQIANEESEAVSEAHDVILDLKEKLKESRGLLDSSNRERDMLKRLVRQRGNNVGSSVGDASFRSDSTAVAGFGGDDDAVAKLADLKTDFDTYKQEVSVDAQKLRDEASQARRDANQAEVKAATANAKIDFLNERYRLLSETHQLTKTELEETSKRMATLQNSLNKQEIAVNSVTNELVQIRSTRDLLAHEKATLEAERKLWKESQERLTNDNASLTKKQSHLSQLLSQQQIISSDHERRTKETRERLEKQISDLEKQVTELRTSLTNEADAHRQLSLRRDNESALFQEKIDKLTSDNASIREQYMNAKTTSEHLQIRVDDITKNLQAREEKLAVYEGRSSGAEIDSSLSREQQLEAEVADLRSQLRTAQVEVEQSKKHVGQFKSISQSNEDALASLNSTYDHYKTTTDAKLAQNAADLTALQERHASIVADLSAANAKNSELHNQLTSERLNYQKDKEAIEITLAEIRKGEEDSRQVSLNSRQDVQQEAKRANEAHEKYERELVAHAEDVKILTELKEKLVKVTEEANVAKAESQNAEAKIHASESSWTRQKQILEQTSTDLKSRIADLEKQNSLLHEHLDSISQQADALKKSSDAEIEGIATSTGSRDGDDKTISQLREVIRHLRHSKEIVDVKCESASQEVARLSQRLDQTVRQLDEARVAIEEERQRANDSSTTDKQHAELMQKINDLNILRESNQSLRDESARSAATAAQLREKVAALEAEQTPLAERMLSLESEIDTRQHHIKLLEDDNRRWKERTEQILEKYERVDPTELTDLKSQLEKLRSDLDASEKAKVDLMKSKTDIERSRTESQQRFKMLQNTAREMRDSKKETEAAKGKLEAEITQIKAEFEQQTQALRNQLAEQENKAKEEHNQVLKLQQQLSSSAVSTQTSVETSNAASNEELNKAREELESARKDIEVLKKENETTSKKREEEHRVLNEEKSSLEERLKSEQKANQDTAFYYTRMNTLIKENTKLQEELKIAQSHPPKDDNASNRVIEADTLQKAVDERLAKVSIGGETEEGADLNELAVRAQAAIVSDRERAVKEAVNKARQELESASQSNTQPVMDQEAIDKLVQSKINTILQEKSAEQDAAIIAAVTSKTEELKNLHRKEIQEAITKAKVDSKNEFEMKNKLQVMQAQKTRNNLEQLRKEFSQYMQTHPDTTIPTSPPVKQDAPVAPTSTSPAPSSSITAPSTNAPVTTTSVSSPPTTSTTPVPTPTLPAVTNTPTAAPANASQPAQPVQNAVTNTPIKPATGGIAGLPPPRKSSNATKTPAQPQQPSVTPAGPAAANKSPISIQGKANLGGGTMLGGPRTIKGTGTTGQHQGPQGNQQPQQFGTQQHHDNHPLAQARPGMRGGALRGRGSSLMRGVAGGLVQSAVNAATGGGDTGSPGLGGPASGTTTPAKRVREDDSVGTGDSIGSGDKNADANSTEPSVADPSTPTGTATRGRGGARGALAGNKRARGAGPRTRSSASGNGGGSGAPM